MKAVKIRSDRDPSKRYTVRLNHLGRAVSCDCPAGFYGRRCKHRARAERVEAFLAARKALFASGVTREAFDALWSAYVAARGVDCAIVAVIEGTFAPGRVAA